MLSRRPSQPKLFCFLILAGGLAGPQIANATYSDFCGSVPGECEYTGPDAPVLAASACWSASTSTLTVMSGVCPSGGWPYFVKYGVVEPWTGHVIAFIPLDDACSRPGICLPWDIDLQGSMASEEICCPGPCWPGESANCEGQALLYCADGVSNEDGTVTCFDGATD